MHHGDEPADEASHDQAQPTVKLSTTKIANATIQIAAV